MIDSDTEYEYSLSRMGAIVLVRRMPNPALGIPAEIGRVYMRCVSEAQAKRVLALLQAEPMGKMVVRP